jgi:wobble nucleotide-excising tRNase
MQSLYRVSKGVKGSQIVPMSYSEIQNDYQSYWSIVRDKDGHPALLANSMRNIIEYFFGFIEKKELSNIFPPELDDIKFQSFNRFINRESHSFGQNIFDAKEFDYEIFQEAFRLVFEKAGYSAHYQKMIK